MSYLLARDTVNGAEGSVFITLSGTNVQVAGMKNVRLDAELQSSDMRVIGTRSIQQKSNGVKQTGSGNIYYGDDLFRDMILDYITTGEMAPFDIQITNSDPTTTLGTQTIVAYGCYLTGTIPIAILNDEEAMLNYDFTFSYTSVAKVGSFTTPTQFGN